eukprot:33148-Hanusia_phi.AAC.2
MLRRLLVIAVAAECDGRAGGKRQEESAASELAVVLADAPAFVDECEEERVGGRDKCLGCCSRSCSTAGTMPSPRCEELCEEFCR